MVYPTKLLVLLQTAILSGATFGTVVSRTGGAAYSDIALDEARGKVYLVNPAASTVDVYSVSQKTFLPSISVPGQPVAEAMSRSGNYLYVTAYASSSLYQIDLNAGAVVATIPVPYHPQGVGVGADERVLITTVGPGGGSATNTLFLFNPSGGRGANSLTPINLTLPPPTTPTTATLGRQTLSYSSALISTRDGMYLVGVNGISSTTRVIFVYETASATILRSREVINLSNVLSIAPDNSRFMAGSTLFDFNTLQVIAQENVANSPFAFPTGTTSNFNLQQNQGGSVFSPDGSTVYAAFNVNPVTNPASAANVTELLLNDPANLRIMTGFQMPENLAGRMVSTAAGDTLYGISDSGFIILPVGSIAQSPVVAVDNSTIFLANDQCGATANLKSAAVNISNSGSGHLTVNVQSYTIPAASGVSGLGTIVGPGGTVITLPTGSGGIGVPFGGGGFAGNGGTVTAGTTTTSTTTTAAAAGPNFQLGSNSSGGVALTFTYNQNATKAGLGTNGESDFLLQSPDAINIAPNVRVFQNNRNAEARGRVFPVSQNISAGEALMDILLDANRQRIYISNSGLNRVEVFDIAQQQLLSPIKVGQLPHNMAFGTDGNTLYVANTGGESISIVNLNSGTVVDSVRFPTLPYDSTAAIVTPQAMAATIRGPLVVMSDGTLYEIAGNQAVPKALNPAVFGSTATTVSGGTGTSAFRTMASTPEGQYAILFTGTGNAYLYNALIDDFTVSKQIFTTLTGLVGPVAAGPSGQYYVVNGVVLNSSLTPVLNGPSGTGATGTTGTTTSTTRPVSAVAAVNGSTYAIFTQPIKSSTTSTATDGGSVQLMNTATGQTLQTANALETSPAVVTGNSRVVTNGRTLAIDSAGGNAYAITVSGLSVIPMTPVPSSSLPALGKTGVVNLANLTGSIAANEMAAVYGSNLASGGSAPSGQLPLILGGTCVTLNNQAMPLVMSSAGQINFQVPPGLAAGKYPLLVRSIANQGASGSATVTISKYAPVVMMTADGQAAIYHSDGTLVTTSNPTTRDQRLVVYGAGLGPTTGGTVTAGAPSPSNPLAVTSPAAVYFGPVGYSQSPVIVEWSGLVPGLMGVYQIDVYVPGTHYEGDAVPVTIQVGGVYSPRTGARLPTIASH